MANKKHLDSKGFEEILSLGANFNLGISDKLKTAFPNIIPVVRPDVPIRAIYHPQWLTGFIDGEGCFYINVQKYHYKLSNEKTDKVWLIFQITQHSRDTLLMRTIIKYLDCGRVSKRNSSPAVDFLVNNYMDISTKVISFLEKYSLETVKQKDSKDFCKAAVLIGKKEHLTVKGIEDIKIIKQGMNKKRFSYI